MAEPDDDDLEPEEEGQAPGLDPAIRRQMRELEKRAKRADGLEAQLEATKREATFAKALGAHANAPWAGIFQRGYDGELTEEAIKAAAAAFTGTSEPQDNLAAHERVTRASAGGTAMPSETDVADLIKAWNEGRITKPEDVLSHAESRGYPTSRTSQ